MTAVTLHIVAGVIAIVLGCIALYSMKGGWLHRKSGRLYVYAMVSMALMGAAMAAVWGRQPASNIPVGLLTAYLVVTGLTTVRPPAATSRRLAIGLMLLAMAVSLAMFAFGWKALGSPKQELSGVPAVPFFIFSAIALLSGIGDLRLLRLGGGVGLLGAPRLTRHLWRMCTALIIAAFSFFPRLVRFVPKSVHIAPALIFVPPLIVLVSMLYWLWRVRRRKPLRLVVAAVEARETS